MEALYSQRGEVTVIAIHGPLTLEKAQSFRDMASRKFAGRKIVFNLQKASFVGSNGLVAFLDAISSLEKTTDQGVRVVGARFEFKYLLSSLSGQKIDFFESEIMALKGWTLLGELDSGAGSAQDLVSQETDSQALSSQALHFEESTCGEDL